VTIQTGVLDGLKFASEITGDPARKPVLLLHGWGGRIESMQPVAEALSAKGYFVHNLDLPGFGRSDLPPMTPEAWNVPDYARFVAHYLDSVALKPVNVIGHSFGGRISIVLGADYPQYIDKIVLTDSAGVLTPLSTSGVVRQGVINVGKKLLSLPGLKSLEPGLRSWFREQYGTDDYKNAGAVEPIFRRVIAEDAVPFAARIKAPTLLIWGDQDDATPLWQGQLLEKTIADSGLVVFQGAGHFAYQERLPDFVRIVDTFFGGNP
jgi:pimeloyl-ACP methyl ester carboxylesterase